MEVVDNAAVNSVYHCVFRLSKEDTLGVNFG